MRLANQKRSFVQGEFEVALQSVLSYPSDEWSTVQRNQPIGRSVTSHRQCNTPFVCSERGWSNETQRKESTDVVRWGRKWRFIITRTFKCANCKTYESQKCILQTCKLQTCKSHMNIQNEWSFERTNRNLRSESGAIGFRQKDQFQRSCPQNQIRSRTPSSGKFYDCFDQCEQLVVCIEGDEVDEDCACLQVQPAIGAILQKSCTSRKACNVACSVSVPSTETTCIFVSEFVHARVCVQILLKT